MAHSLTNKNYRQKIETGRPSNCLISRLINRLPMIDLDPRRFEPRWNIGRFERWPVCRSTSHSSKHGSKKSNCPQNKTFGFELHLYVEKYYRSDSFERVNCCHCIQNPNRYRPWIVTCGWDSGWYRIRDVCLTMALLNCYDQSNRFSWQE